MTFPTPVVRVAPSSSAGLPAYDDIDWTDITDVAMEANVSLGRSDELATFGAGTLSLRMLAPVSIDDEPMEPGWFVQVLGTVADFGTGYVFTGRITSIRKTPVVDQVFVELDATDIAETIASVDLTMSAYEKLIRSDDPLFYWPLDANTPGGYSSKARHTTGLVDGDPQGAMAVSEHYDWLIESSVKPVTGGDFSVELWVKTRTTVSKERMAPIFTRNSRNTDEKAITVGIIQEGLIFGVGTSGVVATKAISDGRTHHIVCTCTAGGTKKIWIDGVDRTGSAPALPNVYWKANLGSDVLIGFRTRDVDWTPLVGTLDEAALYDHLLSEEQVQSHYALGTQGEAPTTLSERVTSLLALAGIDASWLALDASADTTDVYLKPVFEGTLLGELQALALAHGARIHSNYDGKLAVFGFDYFPPVYAHFSDDGTPGTAPYLANDFTLEQNRDDIANDVTGTQVGGPMVSAIDSDSIGRYGRHSVDVGTVRATSPGAVQTLVERHLEHYKAPLERFRSISIVPDIDNLAILTALVVGSVSQVVTVTYEGTTADYMIEGIAFSIAPSDWRITYHLSPATQDDFWRWAESELDDSARWA